jgi:signal transduction histidine kinase
VLNQFDQLNKMTKEILAFARGESSILLRKIFLTKFADELRELLAQELTDKNIKLRIDASFRGAMKMDDVKMKRAIFNLARNAAEAMPGGGDFSINIDREGDDVQFSFTDTGGGIPETIRESVFDSFVTQGKKEGTGLGLAIVKKIVEQHEGSISFTSAVGQGTTFVIRIPIEPKS